jgi:hypothetical protein
VHGGKTERTDNPLHSIHVSDDTWLGKNAASFLIKYSEILWDILTIYDAEFTITTTPIRIICLFIHVQFHMRYLQ